MMAVERKRLLSCRHDMQRTAERLKTEQRADAAPFHRERAAIAALGQWHIGDIENRASAHPTLPSSEIEISFWASTANSIGRGCSTSLTKPPATSAPPPPSEGPPSVQEED